MNAGPVLTRIQRQLTVASTAVRTHLAQLHCWWRTREARHWNASLLDVQRFVDHRAGQDGLNARMRTVHDCLALRTTGEGTALPDLLQDPAVLALAEHGVELTAPVRGLSTRERDNAFVSLLQSLAKPLRDSAVRGGGTGPSWMMANATPEDALTAARREAAKVVYVHDRVPVLYRPLFLNLVVGLMN